MTIIKIHKYREKPLAEVRQALTQHDGASIGHHVGEILGSWMYTADRMRTSTHTEFGPLAKEIAGQLTGPEFSLSPFEYTTTPDARISSAASRGFVYKQQGLINDDEIAELSLLVFHYWTEAQRT